MEKHLKFKTFHNYAIYYYYGFLLVFLFSPVNFCTANRNRSIFGEPRIVEILPNVNFILKCDIEKCNQ